MVLCVCSVGTVTGLAVDRPMSRQRQKCYDIGHWVSSTLSFKKCVTRPLILHHHRDDSVSYGALFIELVYKPKSSALVLWVRLVGIEQKVA